MLTKDETSLVLELLTAAQFNGIQAAARGVALYHKLSTQESNDSPAANQSSPDQPTGA